MFHPLTRRETAALAIILAAVALGLGYKAVRFARGFAASSTVTVSVTGAVAAPGRFEMPEGATLADLLDAASPLEGADLSALSVGLILSDADCVDVPWKEGWEAGGAGEVGEAGPELVDVNTAPSWLLERLPGIGPVLARAIVEHRAAGGPFSRLEDLDNVPGIGPETVRGLQGFAVARVAPGSTEPDDAGSDSRTLR